MTDTALTILLAVTFASSLSFLAWYGGTRAWWRTPEGRALVVSATGWALVSGGFLIEQWRNVPDEAWVVVAALAAAAALLKVGLLINGRHRKP